MLHIEFWTNNSLLWALSYSLLASIFLARNSVSFESCSPIGSASLFSLADFKIFLIVFSSQQFDYDMSRREFICVYPVSVSFNFSSLSFAKLIKFPAIIFSNIFSTSAFFPPFLWKFNYMNVISFIINQQVPEALFIFFFQFSFFLLNWIISIYLQGH